MFNSRLYRGTVTNYQKEGKLYLVNRKKWRQGNNELQTNQQVQIMPRLWQGYNEKNNKIINSTSSNKCSDRDKERIEINNRMQSTGILCKYGIQQWHRPNTILQVETTNQSYQERNSRMVATIVCKWIWKTNEGSRQEQRWHSTSERIQ